MRQCFCTKIVEIGFYSLTG